MAAVPALYALIAALGAGLIFLVQPMAAKAVLPSLGGAPFVWNGCMVFFQAFLLGGYVYAHGLDRLLSVRWQPLVHVTLLTLACFFCPALFKMTGQLDPSHQPLTWLFGMLLANVGLPFFVLSATAPLAQRWFAATLPSRHPYILYAASNGGSVMGLLVYLVVLEPFLTLSYQLLLLFYGLCGLTLLFFTAALALPRQAAPAPVRGSVSQALSSLPILAWGTLSFVPASLLYGVTNYITTDIASAPLFWVLPLGLYLLSFMVAFGTRGPGHTVWQTVQRLCAPLCALFALLPLASPAPVLLVHLLVAYAVFIVCHRRLYELRPEPGRLTLFYLCVAAGGVFGGMFNTFVAPVLFTTILEYPLALIASLGVAGMNPSIKGITARDLYPLGVVWGLFAIACGVLAGVGNTELGSFLTVENSRMVLRLALILGALGLIVWVYFRHKNRPFLQMLWMAPFLVMYTPLFNHLMGERITIEDRNMFGVSRVVHQTSPEAWVFRHGTTHHGLQAIDPAARLEPTTYYAVLADVYKALAPPLRQAPVAVMGMGIGTVACYGRPQQVYDFFEIDPLVVKIAKDARYFTYMRDCAPAKAIIKGDGRIGLSRSENQRYGLIIVDVFSSDSIPVHVLTAEALAMYATKLRAGGLIAFNISNRYVHLRKVVAAVGSEAGMTGVWKVHEPARNRPLQFASEWAVLAKEPSALTPLVGPQDTWMPLPKADPTFLWRDDYSNLLRAMLLP